jgi:1,4-alpha-glucan branching enzyme
MKIIHDSPFVDKRKHTIEFHLEIPSAKKVSLAGTFNHWAQDVLQLHPTKKGVWTIRIPMLPNGVYKYKFFIDEKMWMEDIENPLREPDGCSGWNSILAIN